jgi:hypothetical protein
MSARTWSLGTWDGRPCMRGAGAAFRPDLPTGIRDGARSAAIGRRGTPGAERDPMGAGVGTAADAGRHSRTPVLLTEPQCTIF